MSSRSNSLYTLYRLPPGSLSWMALPGVHSSEAKAGSRFDLLASHQVLSLLPPQPLQMMPQPHLPSLSQTTQEPLPTLSNAFSTHTERLFQSEHLLWHRSVTLRTMSDMFSPGNTRWAFLCRFTLGHSSPGPLLVPYLP